ncbi:MAG: DNA repair protein RadC [Bacilli bacterium]|nr:DNA repair protein RadC [Bacilli bacterium]
MSKIKEIPINDRPIERLLNNGVEILSNEELLSILIKTGTINRSAKDLANEILSKIKDISELKNIKLEQLIKIEGIGENKASTIIAAIELGHRINQKISVINKLKVNDASIIFDYYKQKIGEKFQEHFYAIYLDNNKKIIKEKLLYIGTINFSVVHPREIFKEAYLLSASAIICVHNHPSGNIIPSKQDMDLTNKLVQIGELLGIKICDHIIIGKNKYYSFFENSDIK